MFHLANLLPLMGHSRTSAVILATRFQLYISVITISTPPLLSSSSGRKICKDNAISALTAEIRYTGNLNCDSPVSLKYSVTFKYSVNLP